MLKQLFFSILLLSSFNGFSQSTITIYGELVDAEGDPAPNVRYYFSKKPNIKYKTTRDGRFSIDMKVGAHDTLKFESIQYNPYSIYVGPKSVKQAMRNNDSLYVKIEMPDKTTNIFVVTPNRPDTLCCGNQFSVEDFEFLDNGHMVLLTYDESLKKGAVLRLMDENQKEMDVHYIAGDAVELSRDYRGNVHLLTEERVYFVYESNNEIHTFLEERDYYFKYVAPIIDSIGDNIYFSNYSDIYPAFDYYEFNMKDSTYKVMLEVQDTFMMELYRAEFKYVDVRTKLWAHQRQIETGIDKEIWVGATVFTNSLYYQPLYAPLFKVGEDSILVFDHYKNRMFIYTPEKGFVDSTRITYHLNDRKSGWEQPLLQDGVTGKVYAMFQKSGYTYLSEIDSSTGQIRKSFKLYFKYVDRIQIINNEIFYIYRPFESIQKKFIYREKLS